MATDQTNRIDGLLCAWFAISSNRMPISSRHLIWGWPLFRSLSDMNNAITKKWSTLSSLRCSGGQWNATRFDCVRSQTRQSLGLIESPAVGRLNAMHQPECKFMQQIEAISLIYTEWNSIEQWKIHKPVMYFIRNRPTRSHRCCAVRSHRIDRSNERIIIGNGWDAFREISIRRNRLRWLLWWIRVIAESTPSRNTSLNTMRNTAPAQILSKISRQSL